MLQLKQNRGYQSPRNRDKICIKGIGCTNATKKVFKNRNGVLHQHLSQAALYARAVISYERVVYLRKKTSKQRAKVVVEAKLCFLCLLDKHTFRHCPIPPKSEKDGCNSSYNTLVHGAEKILPAKPSNNIINNSKSKAGTSRPITGQKQLSKTTSLSSVTGVKGLLQVTELKNTKSFGTSTTVLVLCDTACSYSWVSNSLAARLGLQGAALKLTVKGINTELISTKVVQLTVTPHNDQDTELISTKVVQLTVTPHNDQDFEAFTVRPYVRGNIKRRFRHY